MKRLLVPLAGLTLIGSGFGAGIAVSSASADDRAAPAPVVVTRQSLSEVAAPPGAPKRTLGLSKVTVMPGAKLASHHHPGAQLGYIAEGTLTYTVESGTATVMKGSGDDPTVVKKLKAGQTFKVRAGMWLSEEQGEVHHARNAGTVPIVIYLSTLFKTGKPAAISD
jgi:quercetin dioxygenase-like cupin family protein